MQNVAFGGGAMLFSQFYTFKCQICSFIHNKNDLVSTIENKKKWILIFVS